MKEKIEKFLEKKENDIQELASLYPNKKSLVVDYQQLEEYDHDLAKKLINEPDEVISLFEAILLEKDIILSAEESQEKPMLHVRFKNLPKEKGYTIMVRNINSDYISHFLSTDGVVNKISDVLPKVYKAIFYCNRCNERLPIVQDRRMFKEPYKCAQCGRSEFRFSQDESQWIDIQYIEIQEPLELLKGGENARKIQVWVEDDYTDVVTAGDKIIVNGILRLIPPKVKGSVFQKFIEANYIEGVQREFEDIEINKEEEKDIKKLSKDPAIYDKVINSIAPSIYGYREVKEAIALQLFGGRGGKKMSDGTSIRPDIHLLLIGDPGVAKSRMLQYVNNIAPKSIYVTGKGTTGAGLTATAEKDEFADGAWTLKAGALVLAGGGIVAIDEFDKMDKEDRSAMHEAMEQQTISIAKAGMVTKFKANASILAASNPKFSRFDPYKTPAEQFDIPATLISRFDLIFPVKDVVDMEQDRKIAEHILKMHGTEKDMEDIVPDIPSELFRKYISFSRKYVKPVLSEDAKDKIKEYYVTLRASSHGGAIPATPRQLEALIRLAEASAKIRLSDKVTVADAERAINITNFVLKEVAYDKSSGLLDIDRIATDHPKAARDKIQTVENTIREIVGNIEGNTAPLDEIMDRLSTKGISKSDAEKYINELKLKGIIYEPRHGQFTFAIE
ncbi:MAG: minichromosome maintenance protein MCM [Candidatus Altiarchaeota archaeon]